MLKGKIIVYSPKGEKVFSGQGLVTIKIEGQTTVITYQEDKNQTKTIYTNMPYICWLD